MKHIIPVTFILSVLLLTACFDNEQFRVNGRIEGKPTMNLRAGYYADGAYHTLITAAREGEFEFYASATQPTVLEITDYDYRPLGRLYVVNGETYTISIDPANPYAVESDGSDVNRRWSTFLRDNSEALAADPNTAVARYIADNPADIVSTILLLTTYDSSRSAVEADSLMAMIAPEARPSSLTEGYNYLLQRLVTSEALGQMLPIQYIDRRDSLMNFIPTGRPASLIALSKASEGSRDTIVPALRRLNKQHAAKNLAILDFLLDPDTTEWKKGVVPDSATWKQGWAAGGLSGMSIERLGVPSTPFFVVCDSIGAQLYRGASVTRAAAIVDSLLKKS